MAKDWIFIPISPTAQSRAMYRLRKGDGVQKWAVHKNPWVINKNLMKDARHLQNKLELRICIQECGKNGAVDGARTRDPRRDRPVL